MRKAIWRWTVALGAVTLSACGTFPLGTVHSPPGRTAEQRQSDILYCKDQANLAVSTAGRQTQDFLLGLTIVGAPIAYERDKDKQRDVFATCMHSKGYTVDSATNGTAEVSSATGAQRTATSTANLASASNPDVATVKIDLPPGFEGRPLTDDQRHTGELMMSINRAADVGVALWAENHAGVTDVQALATSRRGSQVSRLQEAVPSDVKAIDVGGRKAYRWETRGAANGIRLVYIVTIIEGSIQLVTVSTWTSAANFETQSNLMHGLADRVSGVQ